MQTKRLPAAGALAACLSIATPGMVRADTIISSPAGIGVSVNDESGAYSVTAAKPGWSFAGTLGGKLSHVATKDGSDRLGKYSEIRFEWTAGDPASAPATWDGSIRDYTDRPLVAFSVTAPKAPAGPTPDFPVFTTFPQKLHTLSFQDSVFSPRSFRLIQTSTPWVFFDDQASTAILSPASDFLVSQMHGDLKTSLGSGLNAGVTGLPAGFTHTSFFVVGDGIGKTLHQWGRALTDQSGKVRPTDDADPIVKYLGYWTDNGADYYYKYDTSLGYAGTLLALGKRYREEGIPIRYLQIDSWWYQKSRRDPSGKEGKAKNANLPEGTWNAYGGTLEYAASPDLFPNGLAAFHDALGLPLVVHARWIDPQGPYPKEYKLSGVAPVDERWWNERMTYLKKSGVICYEQDWLNEIYSHSPEIGRNLAAGDAFAGNMARSAKSRGLTLQYCMGTSRFFLQGTQYPNLTTIRTSGDRFERNKWSNFLYTSMLADSLHVRPWVDVFMSTEKHNLTVATLSTGPVGTGDAIGKESKENLLMAARPDGVLVKPDVPIQPTDASIISDAKLEHKPLIASTYTDRDGIRTVYVFACKRRDDMSNDVAFTPASFGLRGTVHVTNTVTGKDLKIEAGETFTETLDDAPSARWASYVIAPVGRSHIALLGDAGKIVGTGRQRITALRDEPGALTLTLAFTPDEGPITLTGYGDIAPTATVVSGTAGTVSFDAATRRFSVAITPDKNAAIVTPNNDPLRLVTVTLRSDSTQ